MCLKYVDNLLQTVHFGIGCALLWSFATEIEIDGAPPGLVRPHNVGVGIVANHHRCAGCGMALLKGVGEDGGMRLVESTVVAQDIAMNEMKDTCRAEFLLLGAGEAVAERIYVISLLHQIFEQIACVGQSEWLKC